MMKNNIRGLENVKKKPVTKFVQKLLFDSAAGFNVRVGFFRKRYTPKAMRTMPPKTCKAVWLLSIKSVMNEIPSPVNKQYIISDSAAPIPVKKAGQRPLFNVRWIQSMPIGPIGAEIKIPIANPRGIIYKRFSIDLQS